MSIKSFTTKEYQIGNNIKIISNNPHYVSGFLTIIITSYSGSTMQFNIFTCNKYASDQLVGGEFGKIISDNEKDIVKSYKETSLMSPNSAKPWFKFFIRRVRDSDNYPHEYVFSHKRSNVSILNKDENGLVEVDLKPKPESTKTYNMAVACDLYQILSNNTLLIKTLNSMKYEYINIDGISSTFIKSATDYRINYNIYKVIKDNTSNAKCRLYRNIPKRMFNSIKYNINSWSGFKFIKYEIDNEIIYIPVSRR